MPDEKKTGWEPLLGELGRREDAASAMGGPEKLARQAARGRLDARARIEAFADPGSFREYGLLAGGQPPEGGAAVPADGLVAGTAAVDGRPAVLMVEDFSVQGGSIGHVGAAKRLRIAELAKSERTPLVIMLDGAGERASNALTRYPYSGSDLQTLADLAGEVPIVALVLGNSAGHGALCGLFADLLIAVEGANLFAAGPPLVKAALGVDVTPEELGSARMHASESGVIHNVLSSESEAFDTARRFLGYFADSAAETAAAGSSEPCERLLEIIPADNARAYDVREVIGEVSDPDSVLELQPQYGASMVVSLARFAGRTALVVANQPSVAAGAITKEAAEKAARFLSMAGGHGLPVVFLADNPGVMAGPDAERAGTLRAAADMYAAQRRLRATKVHVTLRKAFGFGSSLMAMNPMDHQCVTLALPGISLGGVPAESGADASGAGDEERARLAAAQSGAWQAADNGGYDRVIDPRMLRAEIVAALALRR